MLCAAAIGLSISSLACTPSSAQTSDIADAAFNGYNQAFRLTTGGNTFYKKGSGTASADNQPQGSWGEAVDLGVMIDRYDRTKSAADKTMVDTMVSSFLAQNAWDWSGDTYNDDLGWMALCCVRGYQITGNSAYLTKAESAFNIAYNRGWDSTFGGGVWENMATLASKTALANDSLAIAGCYIYQSGGDSTYLTKSQNMYNWVRSHIFDTTTGQVNEAWKPTGLSVSNNVYNSGSFVTMANLLHNITGTSGYYNDAVLAANHVVNNTTVMTNSQRGSTCWQQDFVRGLGYLCRDNNLWDTYYDWLQSNAAAAWNLRRTDFNVTWNSWTAQTPSDDCSSMECLSGAVVQQIMPPRFEVESLSIPGSSPAGATRVLSDSNMAGGAGVILDATAVGDYISFLVPAVGAKKYDIRVGVKKFNSRGICQLAIGQAGNPSPVNVGTPKDLYSSSGQYTEIDFGTWTPATTGDKWFWFTITGKNASSSGYSECFDYIVLRPIK